MNYVNNKVKKLKKLSKKDLMNIIISTEDFSDEILQQKEEIRLLKISKEDIDKDYIKDLKNIQESNNQISTKLREEKAKRNELESITIKSDNTIITITNQINQLKKKIENMNMAEQSLIPSRKLFILKADIYDKLTLKEVYEQELNKINDYVKQKNQEIINLSQEIKANQKKFS